MSTDTLNAVDVTGVLAILGASIYAIGDAFLLAAKVNIAYLIFFVLTTVTLWQGG